MGKTVLLGAAACLLGAAWYLPRCIKHQVAQRRKRKGHCNLQQQRRQLQLQAQQRQQRLLRKSSRRLALDSLIDREWLQLLAERLVADGELVQGVMDLVQSAPEGEERSQIALEEWPVAHKVMEACKDAHSYLSRALRMRPIYMTPDEWAAIDQATATHLSKMRSWSTMEASLLPFLRRYRATPWYRKLLKERQEYMLGLAFLRRYRATPWYRKLLKEYRKLLKERQELCEHATQAYYLLLKTLVDDPYDVPLSQAQVYNIHSVLNSHHIHTTLVRWFWDAHKPLPVQETASSIRLRQASAALREQSVQLAAERAARAAALAAAQAAHEAELAAALAAQAAELAAAQAAQEAAQAAQAAAQAAAEAAALAARNNLRLKRGWAGRAWRLIHWRREQHRSATAASAAAAAAAAAPAAAVAAAPAVPGQALAAEEDVRPPPPPLSTACGGGAQHVRRVFGVHFIASATGVLRRAIITVAGVIGAIATTAAMMAALPAAAARSTASAAFPLRDNKTESSTWWQPQVRRQGRQRQRQQRACAASHIDAELHSTEAGVSNGTSGGGDNDDNRDSSSASIKTRSYIYVGGHATAAAATAAAS
ncbi:hypothetical protein JKP88DRAFT_251320 [Tribonema minus]|uniref:Uncharacterized protein n=1 Tax=Tribonema minus TaxID=303371 RepID=A0A836CME2_9STRA|nr:hypothetical protein JKP88DRAFT_251320 [Tribonema minus]